MTAEIVKWTSSLAVLEKASNLGNLFSYRLSEPLSGDQVMEHPKDHMTEIKFLHVPNTNTFGLVLHFKTGVKAS